MTTFNSYGAVSRRRQAEIMSALRQPQRSKLPDEDLVDQIAEVLVRKMTGR